MPRIAPLTDTDIHAIETAFGITLPEVYAYFLTHYPFPDLAYMRAEDLIELHAINPQLITTINENLRESAISTYAWNENWFSVGERAADEAVFYIDLAQQKPECPVYVLEAGDLAGVPVAASFAAWADERVQALVTMDQECIAWRTRKHPWWKLWN